MSDTEEKTIQEIATELGSYKLDAFEFLREGLDYTVQRTHGETARLFRKVIEWLESEEAELSDLPGLLESGKVPASVIECIERLGGPEAAARRLTLHVGGRDLCLGLRDLALNRWGLMAPAVLRHWGIRSTRDFGRMVFALVDNGLLQKQPSDRIEDFENVYDFDAAFVGSFRLGENRSSEDK